MPIRQAEVAKGKTSVHPCSVRKISLGVTEPLYLLLSPEVSPGSYAGTLCRTFPLCWACHAKACCCPITKTAKSCTTTCTHPLPCPCGNSSILLRTVMHIYTRVYAHVLCMPTGGLLSIWLHQKDDIEKNTWHRSFPKKHTRLEKREDFL